MSVSYIQEDIDFVALSNRTLLASLDIHDCGDLHKNLRWLEKLMFLEKLSLDLSRLCDHDLVHLSKLTRLTSLSLTTNAYITGEKFPILPNLKELNITNERINDHTITDICLATPKVTSFFYYLSGWSSVCPCNECDEKKKKENQKISEEFRLGKSPYYSRECKTDQKLITDQGLVIMVQKWPSLKELSFTGADIKDYTPLIKLKHLEDVNISTEIEKFPVLPNLKKLKIQKHGAFMDRIDQYTSLRELVIFNCGPINQNILKLKYLEKLEIGNVIPDDLKIVGKISQLRELDIRSSKKIGNEALLYLDKLNLEKLNLNYTSVTEEGVMVYKKKHPLCTIWAFKKEY